MAADDTIEDEAAKYPGTIADPWSNGNPEEEGWDIGVSPDGMREATSQEVEWDWCKETNREEPQEHGISARTRVI